MTFIRPYMKNMAAFTFVLFVWFIGEVVSRAIYEFITVPGSILGFIFLFILLQLKIVKLEFVSDLADFFLKHITLLLIPLAISFITHFEIIESNILLILLAGIVVTIVSLALTMKFVDLLVTGVDARRGRHE